jgi:ketosteroid isomerase-like protein
MRKLFYTLACMLAAMAGLAHAQVPVPGQGPDADVARGYFEAVVAGDHEALRAMLADNAVFEDPTSRVEGRDAIIASWGGQNVRMTGYAADASFFSDTGRYVFSGTVRFEQTFQRGDGGAPLTFRFETPYVVVLRVVDGQIAYHRDYVDTGAFATQLNEQIAAARAREAQ